MSRAAQIVANYVQGRDFAYPHSAEEYLAMAYDDMAKDLHRARAERDEMRQRMDSTAEKLAMSVTRYLAADLKPDPRRGTWEMTIRPLMHSVSMMSAHPSKWDADMAQHVCIRAGEIMARMLFAELRKPESK